MKKFYLIFGLSILGITLAAMLVAQQSAPVKGDTEPIPKWHSPFASFVAGTGIVESGSTEIPIGTPVSGIIEKLFVQVGSHVKRGDPLFKIDDSELRAKIPTIKANIARAESDLRKFKDIFDIDHELYQKDPGVISKKRYLTSRDDYLRAKKRLWHAKAALDTLHKLLSRYTVRAPIDGKILRCVMRPGSYMEAATAIPPQLLLGSDTMHLRVDVDEYDAWRVRAGAPAVAFVRGHPQMKVKLRYLYTEPHIVPKRVLTGLPTERTDTRVLQVIYGFEPPKFPLYTGQTMDVFIEANTTKRH
jgi:HlyD family secretion protein